MTNQKCWPVWLVSTNSSHVCVQCRPCFLRKPKVHQSCPRSPSFNPLCKSAPLPLGRGWKFVVRRLGVELAAAQLVYSGSLPGQTRRSCRPLSQTIPGFIHLCTMGSHGIQGIGDTSEPIVYCANLCPNTVFCDKKLLLGRKSLALWDLETEFSHPVAALRVHRIRRTRVKAAENLLWTQLSTCWVVMQRLSCFATSAFVVTQISASQASLWANGKYVHSTVLSDPL